MSGSVCGRCDTVGQTGNYCTSCGYDLRPPEPRVVTPAHCAAPSPPPSIVSCPVCGSSNAQSRSRCARCHAPFTQAPDSPSAGFGPALRAGRPIGGGPRGLVALTAVASLVLLAVLGTLLSARGIGPFASPGPGSSTAEPVVVRQVRASSALDPAIAARLVDGDPASAWVEGVAGPGEGEWVEIDFGRPVRVRRLLVWNGDQGPDRFLERNRVRGLGIRLGGEHLAVELLDTEEAQVVAFPRPIVASRLRLVIRDAHLGTLGVETAIGEVEVYGTPVG
jgi:hypothetical protein